MHVRFICIYHCWANMILYIVLVVLYDLKQLPCVPAVLLCTCIKTKKAKKKTLRLCGQNRVDRVTTNITFFILIHLAYPLTVNLSMIVPKVS